jgi:hypothetical protein
MRLTNNRRRVLTRCATIAAVLTYCGCAGTSASRHTWEGHVDSTDGVVVYNPAAPFLQDGEVVAREEWVIASEVQAVSDDFWENPTRLRATEQRIYVLDPPAQRVHVVSPEGRWTRSLGRGGSGPGEFEQPRDISPIGPDLLVADGGKATVEIVDSTGAFVSSIRIGRIIFSAFAADSANIMVNSFAAADDAGWRVYSRDGSYSAFAYSDSVVGSDTQPDPRNRPYRPANGRLLTFSSTVPSIQLVELDGRVLRTMVIDREPEESSQAELDSFADTIRQTMGRSGLPTAMIREAVDEFVDRWRIKPKYDNARYDRMSNLIVLQEQNPADLGSGPATIHVLTGAGVFLGSVGFSEPWVDFDVLDSRIYVLTRDPATDLAVLRAYMLEFPEGHWSLRRRWLVAERPLFFHG